MHILYVVALSVNLPSLFQWCSLLVRLLGRHIGVYQGCSTNNSSNIDRSSDYDDIWLSQIIRYSNITEESCFTSSRKRMTSNSMKGRYLLSVIYDNYQHGEKEYSRLLLRKKHSACITSKNIFVEDEQAMLSHKQRVSTKWNRTLSPEDTDLCLQYQLTITLSLDIPSVYNETIVCQRVIFLFEIVS